MTFTSMYFDLFSAYNLKINMPCTEVQRSVPRAHHPRRRRVLLNFSYKE